MAPTWNSLADEFAGSSSVLIGDVDCTGSGDALCSTFSISGYPTIKYFVDGNAEGTDYSGGRDFDSLNDFVKETLEVKCSLTDQDLCTDKEKSYIKKMTAKPKEDRLTQIDRLEKMAKESMKAELKIWLRQRLHILRMLEV
jgi:protein disulfide-isomerase A6